MSAKLCCGVALSALLIGSVASPATAKTVIVTDYGTVSDGTDGAGLFGTAGADLTGASYVAVFTFDLDKALALNTMTMGTQTSASAFGLSGFASTVVTIGGVSVSIAPTWGALGALIDTSIPYSAQSHSVTYLYDDGITDIEAYVSGNMFELGSGVSLDYTQTLPYLNSSNAFGGVQLSGISFSYSDGALLTSVDVDGYETTVVSQVPEPATWVMMVAGLAAVGGLAGYRRRRTMAA